MWSLLFIVCAIIVLGTGIFFFNSPESNGIPQQEGTSGDEVGTHQQNDSTPGDVPGGAALDLSNHALTKVPLYVFEKRTITLLDLSNNELTGALPAEVRHLSNLEILDLSNNQFTGVPAEVGQLGKLRVLNLSGNNITGLPHEIANLKNLEILDLRGNTPSTYDLEIISASLPHTEILLNN